jgi:hypothetical protein
MNALKNKAIVRVLMFVLLASTLSMWAVFGQELKATVSKDKVQLGEPFELRLTARLAPNSTIKFVPAVSELAALQNDEKDIALEVTTPFSDSTNSTQKATIWTGKYTLIAWEIGKIIVPIQKISINDSTYLFNATTFYVNPQTIGAENELFDIQEGFSNVSTDYTLLELLQKYWYFVAIVLVGFAGFLWWWRKRKKQTVQPVVVLPLDVRALSAIDELDNKKLWTKGQLKQHYTELSHILRSYMSGRYQLNLLETTTFETKALLKQVGVNEATISTYLLLLKQADMVKFAQSSSDETTLTNNSRLAKQLITSTTPTDTK